MAQNIVENIFRTKKALEAFFPNFPDVKVFDLHQKHLLYGRIDKDGDAVYLDDSNLKTLHGGTTETHEALDFVCDAFSDMKKNIKSAANKGFVSISGLYPVSFKAFKSWSNGDLEYNYNQYLNKVYTTFVDTYVSVDRREEKIKNFKDFTKEFLKFSLDTADFFPVTKTGYITSVHCSPYISGLMLDVAPEQYGLNSNSLVEDYVNDVNFKFIINEVKKFGFMVDKTAPWRLVFNLASGLTDKAETGKLTGGQRYMDRLAVNYDNVFETYYRKAYLDEVLNLKLKMLSLYEAFFLQFSTYEKIDEAFDKSGRCNSVKVTSSRLDRELPPKLLNTQEEDEYWLKIMFKLRIAETETPIDAHSFNFKVNEAIQLHRLFGIKPALEHINSFTKGYEVTNFITKGSYWYGMTDEEHRSRLKESMENANNPLYNDFAIASAKNIK